MTINKDKFHAALCMTASAVASIAMMSWAIQKLF
jgi:hypothetical protein